MSFRIIHTLQKWAFSTIPESYAQLTQQAIQRGFTESAITPALQAYSSLNFNPDNLAHVWKSRRANLLIDGKNDILKLSQLLKTYNFSDEQIQSIIVRNPYILGVSNEEISKRIKLLETQLQIKDPLRVFYDYPKVIDNLENDIKNLGTIFQNYLHYDNIMLGQLLSQTPYLFRINRKKILFKLKLLYNWGFSLAQLQKIFQFSGEFLDTKESIFQTLLSYYAHLCKDKQTAVQLLTENPKLLHLDPPLMLGTKINILKQEGLDVEQIGQVLQLLPNLFIKSNDSLRMKIKLYKSRFGENLKLVDEEAFPMMIDFEYWTVYRPRLLCLQDKSSLLEDLRLSEDQFISKYGCNEKYQEYMGQIPQNPGPEVDYTIRTFHKLCPRVTLLM